MNQTGRTEVYSLAPRSDVQRKEKLVSLEAASTRQSQPDYVRRASYKSWLLTAVGMLGVRLDKPGQRYWRSLIWLAMVAVYYLTDLLWIRSADTPSAALRHLALWYVATVWVVFYGGIILTLGTPLKRRLTTRFGEEKAYRVYEVVIGLVFLNQGFSQGVLLLAYPGTLSVPLPLWVTSVIGVLLFVVGYIFKLWAAHRVGMDTYYCRDMFLDRRIDHPDPTGLVTSGPYRYFKNPMYGIGYAQGYGCALLSRSLEGLLVALLFHASIYVFYNVAERPFMQRVYKQDEQPTG